MMKLRFYNKRRSKYNSAITEYNGKKYHSKKEAGYAMDLDWKVKNGEVISWERQVDIPLNVNGRKICSYIIDFIVNYADGRLEYVDVKGYETKEFKIKWKLVNALIKDINPCAILVKAK